MKKILIVNNNMHLGGVQRALVSLLWSVGGRYDVTLLLFYPVGDSMKDLPPNVRVICPRSPYRCFGITKNDACGAWDRLCRSFYAAVTRLLGRKVAVALMSPWQRKLKGFDVAVSYLHDAGERVFYGGCNDFVLRHVEAERKITFLHCDYRRCGANTEENRKKYAKFDAIAACSGGCAASFTAALPELREKVRVVKNCHRFDCIRELAAQDTPCTAAQAAKAVGASPETAREAPVVRIVTVARLGKEKGVDRALRAVARLGEARRSLQYEIIGDGIQRPLLEKIIRDEGLSDCVRLLGAMDNPYAHIRAAELLLIPSNNEAAPLVIGEAACLGTPVLSTETSSAREMIEQTGYGWVCENTEEGLTEALAALLADPSKLYRKKAELLSSNMTNEEAVAQFEEIIERR